MHPGAGSCSGTKAYTEPISKNKRSKTSLTHKSSAMKPQKLYVNRRRFLGSPLEANNLMMKMGDITPMPTTGVVMHFSFCSVHFTFVLVTFFDDHFCICFLSSLALQNVAHEGWPGETFRSSHLLELGPGRRPPPAGDKDRANPIRSPTYNTELKRGYLDTYFYTEFAEKFLL
jgi:hypothetical protein